MIRFNSYRSTTIKINTKISTEEIMRILEKVSNGNFSQLTARPYNEIFFDEF